MLTVHRTARYSGGITFLESTSGRGETELKIPGLSRIKIYGEKQRECNLLV